MPTRRYGQHFLTDQKVIAKITLGAGVTKTDAVLEIGPGRGVLTRALSAAAKKVLAVEIDRRLFAELAALHLPENVELRRGDALVLDSADLAAALGAGYKLVSNLPYEITSKTLEKFLPLRMRAGEGPTSITLMLQKEVGERIVAKSGGMNRLALFCGYYSEPKILFSVPRGAFSPPPNVDSCVIRFDIRPSPLLSETQETLFFRLTTAAFASKRKQIKNSIVSLLGSAAPARLKSASISPEARPQDISLKQWVTLAQDVI